MLIVVETGLPLPLRKKPVFELDVKTISKVSPMGLDTPGALCAWTVISPDSMSGATVCSSVTTVKRVTWSTSARTHTGTHTRRRIRYFIQSIV